jgi:hypothetical protein
MAIYGPTSAWIQRNLNGGFALYLPPRLHNGGLMAVRHGHYPAGMSTNAALIGTKERRSMATLLLVAVGPIATYWVAW